MERVLHISCIVESDRTLDKVSALLHSLGNCTEVTRTYWYITGSATAEEVRDAVQAVCHFTDGVYVVDAAKNVIAWSNLTEDGANFLRDFWLV